MKSKLSDIATYISEKINTKNIDLEEYISTENMLPDKGGIVLASSLPSTPKTNSFNIGDVLFSNIRTYFRKVWFATFSGGVSADVLVFRSKNSEDLYEKYLYYILSDEAFIQYTVTSAKGTKMPRGDKSAIMNYEVKLPSLPTQKRIAYILSTLDDKIELNRKMNQTLEEMAQALFKSWFVDFDPVHAKAGCSSDEELEIAARELGISKDVLELFPSEFDESELGMIPKGWGIQELSSITEILNGHAFKSGDYTKEGTFVLRTKNFSDDGYVENASDDVYLPDSFLTSHSKFLCEPYDFHLVMVGASIGKTSMILPLNLPALRNQNMWCFRPKYGFASKVFLNNLVKNVVKLQMGFANGSAREFFTKGSFFSQQVIVPSDSVLTNYDKLTMPLLEKINYNQAQIQSLQKIRDTLLPKLLSGELDVSELDMGEL